MESRDMAHTVREGMVKYYLGKEPPGKDAWHTRNAGRGQDTKDELDRNSKTENWRRPKLGSGDERGSTRQNDTAIDVMRRTRSVRGGSVANSRVPVIVAATLKLRRAGYDSTREGNCPHSSGRY